MKVWDVKKRKEKSFLPNDHKVRSGPAHNMVISPLSHVYSRDSPRGLMKIHKKKL